MHKKNDRNSQSESVMLLSTPWPLFNRPSVQLGTLKAYLSTRFPDMKVEACHLYLDISAHIGYPLYQAISERTWLAEAVYAALLFPERFKTVENFFKKEAVGKPLLRELDFKALTNQVQAVSEAFVSSTDWGQFRLAGFSMCLCQLTSGLYFIRKIREKCPNLPLVVGGSMFSGNLATELLETFPEIDFAVIGEGELPLTELLRHLTDTPQGSFDPEMPSVPGIISRKNLRENHISFCQMKDLSHLPPPDYDDYFHLLQSLGPEKSFFPILPMEMSRGCWWRKIQNPEPESGNSFTGCAFCNLNLQWEGYRSKEAEQVISEINHLTTKHKLLSVSVTDNVSPPKTSAEIFTRIAELKRDFRLFCEIRAGTSAEMLERMKTAGLKEVQIGIEALSTSLLKKLNKGTTAIQNLEIMRDCESLGISDNSNLILCFPGSDDHDVAETLRNLDFAMTFRPLKPVHFWLGFESPVWSNPKAFGLRAVFNHPNYAVLFPQDIFRSMRFMIQAYRGDMGQQKKRWHPVRKKIREWEKFYAELHTGEPILSFRNGGDFLIIRQKQRKAEAITHRLVGKSSDIYLFCQKHRTFRKITEQFPELAGDKILSFLKMMTGKKLMFEEDGKYLSLAVPLHSGYARRI